MMLFAATTQGWFLTRSRYWESAALLVIAFTLFRPGFWLDMWQDPYVNTSPAQIMALADAAGDDEALRIRVTGEDFSSGKIVDTTVSLPLGLMSDGDGTARLEKSSGIAFLADGDQVFVDNVVFGGYAQERGIDFDWEVTNIEVDAVRPVKEWFYIPALLLLGLVVFLQRGRIAKLEETA
jgi:hypothetical protein